MPPPDHPPPDLPASQQRWRDQRRYLNENRHQLARLAQQLHRDIPTVQGLLTDPAWIPDAPLPLDDVTLRWTPDAPAPPITGTGDESLATRPLTATGEPFASYAAALADLAPPTVFEDRPCYRLTDITLTASTPQLTFSHGRYFDIINTCEATAHELAQAAQREHPHPPSLDTLPLRHRIGDPRDLTRRTIIPAASVLTIRASPTDGPTIVLHHRDSAKVAHGGGLYQVIPVGVFQPTTPHPESWRNDFDLWRFITREYNEELLGAPEPTSDDDPLDYDAWPLYQNLQKARRAGDLRVFWLGLGMDPLSLVTDLLVAAVFEATAFDDLFHGIVTTNTEGDVLGTDPTNGTVGIPFTHDTVHHFAKTQPMQAAGAALLHLTWHHRDALTNQ